MSTQNEPHDDTLATEVFDREPVTASGASERTAALPTTGGGAQPTTEEAARPQPRAPGIQVAPESALPPGPPERPYLRGPAPFAIVLGVLGLLVAGSVVLFELSDVSVHWDNLGPWTVVAAGVVVLVVGALGVRASRPRN